MTFSNTMNFIGNIITTWVLLGEEWVITIISHIIYMMNLVWSTFCFSRSNSKRMSEIKTMIQIKLKAWGLGKRLPGLPEYIPIPIYPNIIFKWYTSYDVAPFLMLISVDGSVKKCMHDPCMRNVCACISMHLMWRRRAYWQRKGRRSRQEGHQHLHPKQVPKHAWYDNKG